MPPLVNSEISYAKATVPFPIFAAEFDPYNRGYLIVGGGGGEGRSGVPNQISVLDVSNRASITTAIELNLSRDEDSVQSLANLATKDGLITFAGVNSSQQNQDAGKNEHFRSFEIRYPPRKKQKTSEAGEDIKGEIVQLGKRSLFQPVTAPKQEAYQRLLRLSPARKTDTRTKRIGAIATGLAKKSEVIVFDATSSIPDDVNVISKIELPDKAEAADLDVIDTEDGEFSLVYCDDHTIYEQTLKYDFASKKVQKRPERPRRVYQMPFPDTFEKSKARPKFRCIRFLNAENVIALVNKPNKSGAELRLYHLYPTGPAIDAHQMNLPHHIRQASSIDVCALDKDANGNQQVAVAIAGQDISIEVFTTNFSGATDTFSALRNYITLRDVHKQQMTKLCFAPFHSPSRAPDPETPSTGPNGEPLPTESVAHLHPGPQYLRLASVSYGNTVVIDTFPLSPFEPQKKNSRYVLSHPSDEAFWRWAYIIVFSFVAVVVAFLFQSFYSGFSDTDNGVFALLPHKMRDFLDSPAGAAYNHYTVISNPSQPLPSSEVASSTQLREALKEHHETPEDAETTAVVVRDIADGHGFDVDVHPDKEEYLEKDPHAKHWHELTELQKSYWKEKLVKAGQWAENEGEGVLKGVLWSTYAGFVGNVAGDILREL